MSEPLGREVLRDSIETLRRYLRGRINGDLRGEVRALLDSHERLERERDEQIQISARLASEAACNRLTAESAEARTEAAVREERALIERLDKVQRERDQQEQFKFAANKRAEAAEREVERQRRAMDAARAKLDNPPGIAFRELARLNSEAWKILFDALRESAKEK